MNQPEPPQTELPQTVTAQAGPELSQVDSPGTRRLLRPRAKANPPRTSVKRKAKKTIEGAPAEKFRKIDVQAEPPDAARELERGGRRKKQARKGKKIRKSKQKNSVSPSPSYTALGPLIELSPSQSGFMFALPATASNDEFMDTTDAGNKNETSGTDTNRAMAVSSEESDSSVYYSQVEDDEPTEMRLVEESIMKPLVLEALVRTSDMTNVAASQTEQLPSADLSPLFQSKTPIPRSPTPTQAIFLRNPSALSFSETRPSAVTSRERSNQVVQTQTENGNTVLVISTPRPSRAEPGFPGVGSLSLSTLAGRQGNLRSEGSMREILPFNPSDFALNPGRSGQAKEQEVRTPVDSRTQETLAKSQSQLEQMLPSPSALLPSSANVQHAQMCAEITTISQNKSQVNLLPAPNPTRPVQNSGNIEQHSNTRASTVNTIDQYISPNSSIVPLSKNTVLLDLLSKLISAQDISLREGHGLNYPSERAQSHDRSSLHPLSHDTPDLQMTIDSVIPLSAATSLVHGAPPNTQSIGQGPSTKGKQPQRRQEIPADKGEGAQYSLPSQTPPDHSPFIRFISDTLNTMCRVFDNGQRQTHGILEELRAEQERLSSLTEGLQNRLCEIPTRPEPEVTTRARIPSPPPPPRRPRRKGVPTRPNVSDGDWHHFRESIRTHLKKLLNIEQLDRSLLKFQPLTEAEMIAFQDDVPNNLPHLVLSAENFRLDMSQPIASVFNIEAQDIFIEDFLHAVRVRRWYSEQEIPEQLLTYEVVMNGLASHLKHVWRIYKEESLRNPGQVKKTRQLRSARNTRKRSLYLARYEMVKRLIKQDRTLARHGDLMCRIGTEGISSDESDNEHQPVVYRRVSPSWRSFELQNFLWRLDELIFEASKHPIDTNRRIGPGQRSRHRVFGVKVNSNSVAPANLPINCYNSNWLQELRGWQKHKLNMQPEYDFSLLTRPSGKTNAGPSGR